MIQKNNQLRNLEADKIVGRYAPSPTGALHLGNLRTALLAWLQVRLQKGTFLLRMEDLDTPRVVEGSDQQILKDLEWFGLDWDGDVVYQSQRQDLYESALVDLDARGLIYPCYCSRKDVQQALSAPHFKSGVYPGLCRSLSHADRVEKAKYKKPALRCEVAGELIESCGDFVVKRADGLFAYQLAVVVDDLEQGVTDVLRGKDLLESTRRQQYLASLLQPDSSIRYSHAPLLCDDVGVKLSKRDGSMSISFYKSRGKTAEMIIGELAFDLGLIDINQPLSANDLLFACFDKCDLLVKFLDD